MAQQLLGAYKMSYHPELLPLNKKYGISVFVF